ncbi:MAG: hypothetical protein COA79_00465 [Planctomycetota bacterium]|nr:MAG: hypothetical protein COA79_00465 [Planctomycetota bacterium]
MAPKLKIKALFADDLKKYKNLGKLSKEPDFYSILFELSACHTMELEEIHKMYNKIFEFYLDVNEFRITELEDICEDFELGNKVDEMLPYIECLNEVFESSGIVDATDLYAYDDDKVLEFMQKMTGNINDSDLGYIRKRLGKGDAYPAASHQVRLLKRLSLVKEEEEDSVVYKKIEKAYPGEKGTQFFLASKVHANEYCREDNPSCRRCPFLQQCPFGLIFDAELLIKEEERDLNKRLQLEDEQRKEAEEKQKQEEIKNKELKAKRRARELVLKGQADLVAEDKEVKPKRKYTKKKKGEDGLIIEEEVKVVKKVGRKKKETDQDSKKVEVNSAKKPAKKEKAAKVAKEANKKKDKSKVALKKDATKIKKAKEKVIAAKKPKKETKKPKTKVVVAKKAAKKVVKPKVKPATKKILKKAKVVKKATPKKTTVKKKDSKASANKKKVKSQTKSVKKVDSKVKSKKDSNNKSSAKKVVKKKATPTKSKAVASKKKPSKKTAPKKATKNKTGKAKK